MNTITIAPHGDISGTFLQGNVVTSYEILKRLFGKHTSFENGSKMDAEWVINTPFGIGTVYNYKDGKNYNGKLGSPLKDITDWHIGGKNKETAIIIQTAIEAFAIGYNN